MLYSVLLPLVVILSQKDTAMSKILDSLEIGQRIKQFRKHKGLSQEKLAELIGVSFQQVQKYERRTHKGPALDMRQFFIVPTQERGNDEKCCCFDTSGLLC